MIYLKDSTIKAILISGFLLIILLIVFDVPVIYLDHSGEGYSPPSHVAEKVWIETARIHTSINDTDEKLHIFKSHVVGPYALNITMLGHASKDNFKKLIIHSVIIKDALESKEFIIHSINDAPLDVPMYNGTDDFEKFHYLTQASYNSKRNSNKTFYPLFSEEQKLEVVIDISVEFKDKTIRKSFTFHYEANAWESKEFLNLKQAFDGLMSV